MSEHHDTITWRCPRTDPPEEGQRVFVRTEKGLRGRALEGVYLGDDRWDLPVAHGNRVTTVHAAAKTGGLCWVADWSPYPEDRKEVRDD